MKNLKLTAQVSTRSVFISESIWRKLGKQKNVTWWFYNCVINLFKNWEHVITNDNSKRYKVKLEEVEVYKPY